MTAAVSAAVMARLKYNLRYFAAIMNQKLIEPVGLRELVFTRYRNQ